MEATVARLGASLRTDKAAAARRQAERRERMDARWQPEAGEDDVGRRLRVGE